ncbi:MAG: IS21 family transposase [Myxococcales bacterium]|nr:IS21 family transposase [Myxococcales bacterium]
MASGVGVVSDRQVLKLMAELSKHNRKGLAALRAGMARDTARKYLASGELPSSMVAAERTYLTREDPFAQDWAWVESVLVDVPELEAKALFEHMEALWPGRYDPGQVRTLQRRVRRWRAQHGPELEVFFAQEHRPGEAGQTDFTSTAELRITIGGALLEHLLCHFVLPYSNWQWATVAYSESLLGLRRGVQSALLHLGRRPEWHQTDNSTAATHELATGGRGFNEEYLAMMRHFEMKPRTIGVGESEQNGDVEAANGALKRRLEQYLKLRGSRDFETVDGYETWVQSKCDAANVGRCKRVTQELAVMAELNPARLCEHVDLDVPVTTWSTVRVKDNVYSVPSRLIGKTVRVRLTERHVEVWFAGRQELKTERLVGRSGHRIDYRHIIWSLVRKPGAFARWRYREDLFPTLVFRRAYDALRAQTERESVADVAYLRLLHLAASTLQVDVEAGIELLLAQGQEPTTERVKLLMGKDKLPAAPDLPALVVDLREYDALLGRGLPGLETGT